MLLVGVKVNFIASSCQEWKGITENSRTMVLSSLNVVELDTLNKMSWNWMTTNNKIYRYISFSLWEISPLAIFRLVENSWRSSLLVL